MRIIYNTLERLFNMFNDEIKSLVLDLSKEVDGVVVYTDGSHEGSFNLTGGGIHGYTYKNDKPKRGLGLGKWKATKKGYSDTDVEEPVTVVEYFDGILSLGQGTNNTAELKTGALSLEIVNELSEAGIKNAQVMMDSKYVIDGIVQYVDKWAEQNWIKQNGSPLMNTDIWKAAYDTKNKLKDNNVTYSIDWVKGHSGDPGNESADVNATIGRVLNSINKDEETRDDVTFAVSEAQGYWKTDVSDKVSLLTGTSIIFDSKNYDPECRRFHVFSNEQTDTSMYGISDNTACYGVIELSEPPSFINAIIERQKSVLKNIDPDLSMFYQLHIRNAFSPKNLGIIKKHGTRVLTSGSKYKELRLFGSGSSITEILYPIRFAVDGITIHQALSVLLDEFIDTKFEFSKVYKLVDITEHVYDMTDDGKKKICKLKEELNSSSGHLDLSKHCPDIKTDYGFNPLVLSFGSDLPRREIVSGAAKLNPKAHLLHWEDSGSFKRAFVLETDEGVSIWHNPWRSVL